MTVLNYGLGKLTKRHTVCFCVFHFVRFGNFLKAESKRMTANLAFDMLDHFVYITHESTFYIGFEGNVSFVNKLQAHQTYPIFLKLMKPTSIENTSKRKRKKKYL